MRDDKLSAPRTRCKRLFSKASIAGQTPFAFPLLRGFQQLLHCPMALDLAQVRRIADLARINVTDAEAQRTLAQLHDIFA